MWLLCFVLFLRIKLIFAIPAALDCRSCNVNACNEAKEECCNKCGISIGCYGNKMEAYISKYPSIFPLASLSLADSSCGGTDNGTHYIFVTGLKKCDTQLVSVGRDHFVYRNEIIHSTGKPIYALTCLIKRKVEEIKKPIPVKQGNEAAMYHTSVDGRRFHKNTMYVDSDDYVFFEVKGPRYLKTNNLVMGMRMCYLEDKKLTNGIKKKDYVLKKGCPTRREVQVIHHTTDSFWFSVYMRNIPANKNETVILNCDIVICSKKAKRRCMSRNCNAEANAL